MVSRSRHLRKKAWKLLGVLADAPDHAAGTKPTYVNDRIFVNDMQAKWRGQGRMTSSCTLLSTVTASAQLWSKEFWDFLGSRRGKRLLCCSLSRTTTPALWVSVLVVGKEAYARDAEDEQLTFLWRLVDISECDNNDQPKARWCFTNNNLNRVHLFLLACQWRRPKIIQLRTGWRHARQQPDFLLLLGTCGDSLSGTTTGDGAAEWIKTIVLSSPFSSTSNRRTALKLGTTDLRGQRNTLVQKK